MGNSSKRTVWIEYKPDAKTKTAGVKVAGKGIIPGKIHKSMKSKR